MPRNGSGSYALPPGNPVTSGTLIQSAWANTTLADIGAALTGSIAADGQTALQANLNMAGFRLANMGAAVAPTHAVNAVQVQSNNLRALTGVVESTPDNLTATLPLGAPTFSVGQEAFLLAVATNVGPVTLSVNGGPAYDILGAGGGALRAGDIQNGRIYQLLWTGAAWQLGLPTATTTGSPIFDVTDHTLYHNTTKPASPAGGTVQLYAHNSEGSVARLAVQYPSGVEMELFRDASMTLRNATGGVLTHGTAVYLAGSDGTAATMAKAKADNDATMVVAGLLLYDVPNGSYGAVQTTGVASGLDTSAWNVGDPLYLSATTAGALTNVLPTAFGQIAVLVGRVVAKDATNGKIQLNLQPGAINFNTLPNITATNVTINNGSTKYMLPNSDTVLRMAAESYASFYTSTSAGAETGDFNIRAPVFGTDFQILRINAHAITPNPTNTVPVDMDLGTTFRPFGSVYMRGNFSAESDLYVYVNNATSGVNAMHLSVGGAAQFGTTAPMTGGADVPGTMTLKAIGARLEFVGDAGDINNWPVGSLPFFTLGNTPAANQQIGSINCASDGVVAGNRGGRLTFSTKADGGVQFQRMAITQAGDVGIGTTTPNYDAFSRALTIEGNVAAALELSTARADANNAAVGPLSWQFRANSATHQNIARITGVTDGGVANQRGGAIAIFTKPDGVAGIVERIRISSNGNLGLGVGVSGANIGARLVVGGSEANNTVGGAVQAAVKIVNTEVSAAGRMTELHFAISPTTLMAAMSCQLSSSGGNTQGNLILSTRRVATDANVTPALWVAALGSVGVSNMGAALATTATDGFFGFPTMAGTPTGAPVTTNFCAMAVVDTTGSKLWVRVGAAWKSCALI